MGIEKFLKTDPPCLSLGQKMSAILERQKGEKEFVCFMVFWAERRRTEKIIVMREKRRRWLFCLNPNPTPPKIKKKFLLMRGRLVSRSSFKFKISSEAGGKNKARVGSYPSEKHDSQTQFPLFWQTAMISQKNIKHLSVGDRGVLCVNFSRLWLLSWHGDRCHCWLSFPFSPAGN